MVNHECRQGLSLWPVEVVPWFAIQRGDNIITLVDDSLTEEVGDGNFRECNQAEVNEVNEIVRILFH